MFYFSKAYEKFYSHWQDFRISFKQTFSRFYCLLYAIVNFLLNILLWWGASFLSSRASQPLLVLHYNVDFGIDWIGPANMVFILPALSLIFVLLNLFVLIKLEKTKYFKFVSYLILNITIFINLFFLASLMAIYLINFR